MNQVMQFKFDQWGVRAVYDTSGEPLFVAADVCSALDIGNSRMAMDRLDEDEKGVSSIDTPGGPQEMAVVNESGLYSLILGSRKPQAKAFKRWVTHEVLPTIRRTGAYAAKPVKPASEAAPVSSDWLEQSTRNAQALIDLVSKRIGMDEAVKDMPTKISVPDLAMGLAGLLMKRERFLLEFWDVQNPTLRRLHSKEVLVETQSPDWADQLMKRLTSEQAAQIMHAAARRMAG